MLSKKVKTLAEASKCIKDDETVVLNGFITAGVPNKVYRAVAERYSKELHPKNITLLYSSGIGDKKEDGVNILAKEGLIKKVICGHWNLTPELQRLVIEEKIEGYNLPQGVICQLYRDIAAKRPGLLTTVGLDTFVDPDYGGGKLNNCSKDELVKKIKVDQQEYLFYKAFPIHTAILKGTAADKMGNISIKGEHYPLETLDIAIACKNCGGKVIVQVDELYPNTMFGKEDIALPFFLVDYIVKEENTKVDLKDSKNERKLTVDKQIIVKRAALELKEDDIVNFGIGLPEQIIKGKYEMNKNTGIISTLETGVIGGEPLTGIEFGNAINPITILKSADIFNWYDGGGLNKAFLGMAEVDKYGNVNVSYFSDRIAGAGGFINISQGTLQIIFCGSFSVGAKYILDEGKLTVIKEGKCKFVSNVKQITFNGRKAWLKGKCCLYITERAVFRLCEEGLEIIEIAPGIDLERDILAKLDFDIKVSTKLKNMPIELFQ